MNAIAERVLQQCASHRSRRLMSVPCWMTDRTWHAFVQRYAPERLELFRTRLLDRALLTDELMRQALGDGGRQLAERLQREFMKDSLQRRQSLFRLRSYDRTVHPTQMYSIPGGIGL
jgi:hypothetical protein